MSYAQFGGVERRIDHATVFDLAFAVLVAAWIPWLITSGQSGSAPNLGWLSGVGAAVAAGSLVALAASRFVRRWESARSGSAGAQDGWVFNGCPECGGAQEVPAAPQDDAAAPPKRQPVSAELSELRSQVAMLNLLVGFSRDIQRLCTVESRATASEHLRSGIAVASTIYRLLAGDRAVEDLRKAGVLVSAEEISTVRDDIDGICHTLRELHLRWLGEEPDGRFVIRDIDQLEAQTARYAAVERLFFHTTVLVADVATLTGVLAEGCSRSITREPASPDAVTREAALNGFHGGWSGSVDLEEAADLEQLLLPLDPRLVN